MKSHQGRRSKQKKTRKVIRKKVKKAALKIKIWGARGSLPTPTEPAVIIDHFKGILEDFFDRGYCHKQQIEGFLKELPQCSLGGYGGNTACIEVMTPSQRLIVDAGSGIRRLGYELMQGPCGKGMGEVHLFFTHFHWDHLIGLPFFTPLFIPGNKIHVYAVQPELPSVFKTLFRKPYFPVELESLGSQLIYHRLEPRKTFLFDDLKITPYQLDHPDPCWGYRFERNGKVFSYCVDTECTRASREELGSDLPLYQGVDLMIFDAQYTLMESIEKINWGHAAASYGLDIAMREGIKKVVFIHHDPASSDMKIAEAEAQARRYYNSQVHHEGNGAAQGFFHPVEWLFGHEGLVLEI